MLSVPCPRCGVATDADESKPLPPAFPFCTERCRLIDLGKWANEEYRVDGGAAPSETPRPDDE